MSAPHQDELLERHLKAILGGIDPAALQLLREQLEWVHLASGETLMVQGEAADSMYLSISGRLRAYVRDEQGRERFVREMARGQIIGEMGLYTDAPRSATVIAIRDSVLVRLRKSQFDHLLASSAQVSTALARQVVQRMASTQQQPSAARPVAIALVPITPGTAALDFAHLLAAPLRAGDRVCVIDADTLDRDFSQPGLARSAEDDAAANRRIAIYLDELEAAHDFVLLVGDDEATPWTERCCRRCDEVLLLADADRPSELHASEERFLMHRPGRAEAAETLVLLHPADRRCPRGTRAWLARRPLTDHIHIRPALERDMARLARLQSRTAIGLVLAGGGARGCAHLGIYRALVEQGVEIDYVGGTSIGGVMSALVASDLPVDEVTAIARRAISVNPTGDYNLLPLVSLIGGRRLRRVVETAVDEMAGFGADIEDLWKNHFCIASNYSQASEEYIADGSLLQGLLASIAIPGALPPVLRNGDLLCDGGTFNNFPVDAMRKRRGVGKVIGVDLSFLRQRRVEHAEIPGTWALLRDRLRKPEKRRYQMPSLLAYLMNVTVLYSTSRQRAAQKLTDLYFNPPLQQVGLLQWRRFDDILAQGLEHGRAVLGRLDRDALRPFRRPPP